MIFLALKGLFVLILGILLAHLLHDDRSLAILAQPKNLTLPYVSANSSLHNRPTLFTEMSVAPRTPVYFLSHGGVGHCSQIRRSSQKTLF